ncbi:MAG: hypothetical protein C0180_05775 [Aciduliprofundum sp.]|nr:MAG: hypothetical protein C0180_05775 [Aciduliprofundum sp.]
MEINRAVTIVFSLFLEILDESEPEDKEYEAIREWAKSTENVLNIIYPPNIFNGSSGDEVSMAIALIRKVIEK